MNIGFNLTRQYLKYTYVLVKSILESNPDEEICFYIYSANIEVPDLDLMCELVESHNGRIELLSIDKSLIEMFLKTHILDIRSKRIRLTFMHMRCRKGLTAFYAWTRT